MLFLTVSIWEFTFHLLQEVPVLFRLRFHLLAVQVITVGLLIMIGGFVVGKIQLLKVDPEIRTVV